MPKIKPFTVVIDAGHGGHDSGTVGNGLREKDVTLAIALSLGKIIAQQHPNVRVFYTRKTDFFVPLQGRADFANRNGGDLFISIHANSAPSKQVNGTETFILGSDFSDKDSKANEANLRVVMRENEAILLEDNYSRTYRGFDPSSTESYIMFDMMKNKHLDQSVRIGTFIQNAYAAAGRNSSRGVKKGNLLVIRNTAMPGVLTEVGFITNKAEAEFLASDNGRNKLAQAIANGFSYYLADYSAKNGIKNTQAQKNEVSEVKSDSEAEEDSIPDEARDVQEPEQADRQTDKYREAPTRPTATQRKPANRTGAASCSFRIQLISAAKKVKSNDSQFRGYKVQEEQIGKRYAYTTGCAASLAEAKRLRANISKRFKDAFIVQYEDGKRIRNIY